MPKTVATHAPDPDIEKVFETLAEKWPSTVISRDQIFEFTGGAISRGRMANLDSLGDGPERIRIGRKIVYPVGPLIKWLIARTQLVERNPNHAPGSN